MTPDLLLRTPAEEASPLGTGRYRVVPERSAVAVLGAPFRATSRVRGAAEITASGVAFDVAALVDGASRTAAAGPWPDDDALTAFPGVFIAGRTALWTGSHGLALGGLTMVGLHKTAAFDIELRGFAAEIDGRAQATIAVSSTVDLADWGLEGGMADISLRLVVADDIGAVEPTAPSSSERAAA